MKLKVILKSFGWFNGFKSALCLLFFFFGILAQTKAQTISMNGPFKLYYPNSKNLFLKGQYLDSLATGEWKFFDQTGAVTEIHRYMNGQLNDTFKRYYQKYLKVMGKFKNNNRQGLWTTYNQNGIWGTQYYQNDTLQGLASNKSHQIIYKNGKANGPYIGYDYLGKLRTSGTYVNDSREGIWILKDGAIYRYTFKNNVLNDTSYQYYADSVLNQKSVYKNGKLNGPTYYYRAERSKNKAISNHTLWKIENYKDNNWHGSNIQFFNNGDTAIIEHFENNNPVGIHKHFAFNRTLTEWHKFDKIPEFGSVDSAIFWNDSGRLLRSSNKSRSNYQTPYFERIWDAQGKLAYSETKQFQNKILHHDIYDYSQGILVSEKHFQDGIRWGRWYKKGKYDMQYIDGKSDKSLDSDDLAYDDMAYRDMEGMAVEGDGSSFVDDRIENRLKRNQSGYRDCYCTLNRTYKLKDHKAFSNPQLDSLKLSGSVIIELTVFQNGYPAAPRFIKHLHPLADQLALHLAINQTCRPSQNRGTEQTCKYYITFEF
jgi:antitoxin component YwqK of YwqJK toxin-antitoxin module